MNHPFTIAHISDLHISLDHSRQNVRNTRTLIEYCLRNNASHIVITGDITANAEKKELEAARKIFRSYDLLDSRKLSLIIGNHDLYGGVHRAEEIFSFPKRCKSTNYDHKAEEFREAFHEVFEDCIHGKHSKFYPFVKVLNGIALFGINSIARYSSIGNPIGSNGEVDSAQFGRVKDMLSSELFRSKKKIVLIHHHFHTMASSVGETPSSLWNAIERQTMKLRNKKRLLEVFSSSNIDLVLHGHVHENREYMREGIRFVNTGASLLSSDRQLGVTFVKSTNAGIETEVHTVPYFTTTSATVLLREQKEELRKELITHAAA